MRYKWAGTVEGILFFWSPKNHGISINNETCLIEKVWLPVFSILWEWVTLGKGICISQEVYNLKSRIMFSPFVWYCIHVSCEYLRIKNSIAYPYSDQTACIRRLCIKSMKTYGFIIFAMTMCTQALYLRTGS